MQTLSVQIYQDCDYVEDINGDFWIICGNNHKSGLIGTRVYEKNILGSRTNANSFNYKKLTYENHTTEKIPPIVKVFNPREHFQENYLLLPRFWKLFADTLLDIGIPFQDIGIFGSTLIGFPLKKDIDFVIYGKSNRDLLFRNISKFHKILSTTPITKKHIDYQVNSKTSFFSNENSFHDLLKNKWSSIQIIPGLLSTIRFVYKNNETPKDLWKNKPIKRITIQGKVKNSWKSDFRPRAFDLITSQENYCIATKFWIYQSCVKDNMEVTIHGTLRENNIITLDDKKSFIKVIN